MALDGAHYRFPLPTAVAQTGRETRLCERLSKLAAQHPLSPLNPRFLEPGVLPQIALSGHVSTPADRWIFQGNFSIGFPTYQARIALQERFVEVKIQSAVSEDGRFIPEYNRLEAKGPKTFLDKPGCPKLEIAECLDPHKKRILLYGDAHCLIFPFLQRAVEKGILQLPLGPILNVDYHADINTYSASMASHTDSWQRRGVDEGFWRSDCSYNWQPEDSRAQPMRHLDPDRYIRSVSKQQAKELMPEVLSIDLDFLMEMKENCQTLEEHISAVRSLAQRAKCVFVFSSSAWTDGALIEETFRKVIYEIQSGFLDAPS